MCRYKSLFISNFYPKRRFSLINYWVYHKLFLTPESRQRHAVFRLIKKSWYQTTEPGGSVVLLVTIGDQLPSAWSCLPPTMTPPHDHTLSSSKPFGSIPPRLCHRLHPHHHHRQKWR